MPALPPPVPAAGLGTEKQENTHGSLERGGAPLSPPKTQSPRALRSIDQEPRRGRTVHRSRDKTEDVSLPYLAANNLASAMQRAISEMNIVLDRHDRTIDKHEREMAYLAEANQLNITMNQTLAESSEKTMKELLANIECMQVKANPNLFNLHLACRSLIQSHDLRHLNRHNLKHSTRPFNPQSRGSATATSLSMTLQPDGSKDEIRHISRSMAKPIGD